MATYLATWGQIVDYTIKYKAEWKVTHQPSYVVRNNSGHFTKWSGGTRGFKVKDIKQDVINRYIDYLDNDRELSNTTIKKCTVAVSTALNYCVKSGKLPIPNRELPWVTKDWNYKFDTRPDNDNDRVWISVADCDHFYQVAKACGEDDLADTIWLSCYTGLSWHEWSQLQVRDIDLNRPIPAILIGKRCDFKTKNGSRPRIISLEPGTPVFERVYPILRRRIEGLEDHPKLNIFDAWQNDDAHRRVWNRIRDLTNIKPYGVGRFTPNCARHTCLTWLALGNAHCSKVQDIAGHANPETSMKYYIHLGEEHLAKELGRIGTPLTQELQALSA